MVFFMKNVTFRVLFTEGGTLWQKVPKRCQKVSGVTSPFWMHFCSKVIQRAPLGANCATHVCKRAPQGRPGPPREISKSVFEGPRGGALKPTSDSDPPGGGQKLDFGQPSDGLGRSQGGGGAALGARFGGPFVPQKRSESQERSQRPPRGPPKGQVHFKKRTQSRPGGFWRDFLGAFESDQKKVDF